MEIGQTRDKAPPGRTKRAGAPDEERFRFLRRLLDTPRALAVARETRVGTTPCDVVYESGSHRLLRYRRETPATWAEPVIFCYALINRPYILDLQPDKSVVRQYLARGFDVYIIDWGVPTHGDRTWTIEHYVSGFLSDAVRAVLEHHARKDLHLLGYCMGGTMSALFTALHPSLVKTMSLLAAPIDFASRDSLLNVWADRKNFDVDAFVDAHGNCPGWYLQACFQQLKPVQNYVQKYLGAFDGIEDPAFLSNFFAMELWVNDNIPVAGETFRWFVKELYQGNRLVGGGLELGAQRVELRKITCPMLLLTAKNDHLVVPAATEGIRPHVGSEDIESIGIDAGHVGLVVGGKAQRTVWPRATQWLADRSTSVQSRAS